MSKRILVLNGNPKQTSYSAELAEAYLSTSQQHNDVRLMSLHDMDFDSNLINGYDQIQPLEADLESFQKALTWAEHVVIISPVWWGGIPAKLKGLFDRTILPGFAFKYHEGKSIPEKLLAGRTADIVLTMDTPPFFYRWFQGNPAYKQLKNTTLAFCGFKKISATYIGPVINSSEKQRAKWQDVVTKMGAK